MSTTSNHARATGSVSSRRRGGGWTAAGDKRGHLAYLPSLQRGGALSTGRRRAELRAGAGVAWRGVSSGGKRAATDDRLESVDDRTANSGDGRDVVSGAQAWRAA